MNSCELTASITVLANTIAGRLSINELALLGAALNQLGDTLATIAAQRALCEEVFEERKSQKKSDFK